MTRSGFGSVASIGSPDPSVRTTATRRSNSPTAACRPSGLIWTGCDSGRGRAGSCGNRKVRTGSPGRARSQSTSQSHSSSSFAAASRSPWTAICMSQGVTISPRSGSFGQGRWNSSFPDGSSSTTTPRRSEAAGRGGAMTAARVPCRSSAHGPAASPARSTRPSSAPVARSRRRRWGFAGSSGRWAVERHHPAVAARVERPADRPLADLAARPSGLATDTASERRSATVGRSSGRGQVAAWPAPQGCRLGQQFQRPPTAAGVVGLPQALRLLVQAAAEHVAGPLLGPPGLLGVRAPRPPRSAWPPPSRRAATAAKKADTAVPVSSESKTSAASAATARLRRTHLTPRSTGPAGRALIVCPLRNRRRSSARSSAEAYRRAGSFSRHFRQIVSRSRGTAGTSSPGGTGSRAITW